MRLENPQRLRKHAADVRARTDREFEALRELEQEAPAKDGVLNVQEALHHEELPAWEILAAIKQEEARYADYAKQRSLFTGGQDEHSQQCLQVLMDRFRREPLAQLRVEAAETINLQDNLVVANLADVKQLK